MTETKNLLDTIFNAPEEDVEAFADVFLNDSKDADFPQGDQNDIDRLRSGKPDRYRKVDEFISQKSGFVSIEHNWFYEDYVWHMCPASAKRPWKVSIERVIYAVAVTLNKHIPKTIHIDLHPPVMEWEIQEITVKARDLKNCWSISDREIEALTTELFEVLNTLL